MTASLKIDTAHFIPARTTEAKAAPKIATEDPLGSDKNKVINIKTGKTEDTIGAVKVTRTVVYTNEDGELVSEIRDPKVGMVVASYPDKDMATTYKKDATIRETTQTPLGKDPSSED